MSTLTQLGSLPALHHPLTKIPVAAGRHSEFKAVSSYSDFRRSLTAQHTEPICHTQMKMGFAGNIAAGALPCLSSELCLLPLDPTEPRDNGQPHRVIVDCHGRSDANPTVRRINTQMQIFDLLPDDLDINLTD